MWVLGIDDRGGVGEDCLISRMEEGLPILSNGISTHLREYLDIAQHPAMWQLAGWEVGGLLSLHGLLLGHGVSPLSLPSTLLPLLSIFIVLRGWCLQMILKVYWHWRWGRAGAQCHSVLDDGSGRGKVTKLLVL